MIVEGKDEAVFCEGDCQQWIHRGCASISQKMLATLSTSSESFLCLTCSRVVFQEQMTEVLLMVNNMKAELQQVPILKDTIVALKDEVASLSKLVSELQKEHCTSSNVSATRSSYTSVSSAPRERKGLEEHQPKATSAEVEGYDKRKRPKVKVRGVRRIWGTLKATPTSAVSATLKKLTTLGEKVSIKRKLNSKLGSVTDGGSSFEAMRKLFCSLMQSGMLCQCKRSGD